MKQDVYERITGKIVAELEKGVRPWFKPWNAEYAAGRITRPLRFNGVPYQGINVLMLWGKARNMATYLIVSGRHAQHAAGGESLSTSADPPSSGCPRR